jgi:S-disulfanyl-L-cysteine oxidoreductase SoxD
VDGGVVRPVLLTVLVVLLAGCADIATTDDPDQVRRGEELYGAHCIACHGGATGGSITDIPPPHNAEGHTWHHPDCVLVDIILDGMPRRRGEPAMPAFGNRLSEEDAHAILAYIKTWWEPHQIEFQEEVTERACD